MVNFTLQAAINDPNFIGFCHESTNRLLTGDFDADKRSDLVCRINGGSQYKIALSGECLSAVDVSGESIVF